MRTSCLSEEISSSLVRTIGNLRFLGICNCRSRKNLIAPSVRATASRGVCRPPRLAASLTRRARGDTSGPEGRSLVPRYGGTHNALAKADAATHQGVLHGPVGSKPRDDVA